MSSNIFRITGPLWGESNSHRWIPLTKASGTELWCFLWSALEHTVNSKQSRCWWFETPLRHCNVVKGIIGSDNGLSPVRRRAIILTNAGILLTGLLGTNFSENSIGIQTFSFKKMHLKMSSAKWRLFCLGLNVLIINPEKSCFYPIIWIQLTVLYWGY